MYPWIRWEITSGSLDHKKNDARTIEFRPTIARGGEATINYTDPLQLVNPRQAVRQSVG